MRQTNIKIEQNWSKFKANVRSVAAERLWWVCNIAKSLCLFGDN